MPPLIKDVFYDDDDDDDDKSGNHDNNQIDDDDGFMLQLEYNPPALSLSFASNLQSRPLGEILEISFVMMMITIFVTIVP